MYCTRNIGRTTPNGGARGPLVFGSREVRVGVRPALEALVLRLLLPLPLPRVLARLGVEVVARASRSGRATGAPRLLAIVQLRVLRRVLRQRGLVGCGGGGSRARRWRRFALQHLLLRVRLAERHTAPVRVLQNDALLAFPRLSTHSVRLNVEYQLSTHFN